MIDKTKVRYIPIIALIMIAILFTALLTLSKSTSDVAAESPTDMVNVVISYKNPPGPPDFNDISDKGGTPHRTYYLVPAVSATVSRGNIPNLKKNGNVKAIDEDIIMYALAEVIPWGVDRIDAELVHPTNKGTGIKVAILDTGIDLSHPDLNVAGNVTFVSGTTSGNDDNGHGTLVAGIAAALDNDIGVIGVAPEASLYAVKVLGLNGGGYMSDIMSGLQWAIDNGMQVINMSFGGGPWPSTAIDLLNIAYNAGIVLVAGAGNSGNPGGTGDNIIYPARYDTVIAVGATDEANSRLSSSGTGYTLELAAPGNNIYSTALGGGYGYLGLTSAASPHVAGAAALLRASGMTGALNIRNRLRNSSQDLGEAGWDSKYGAGIANAFLAISFTEPPDQSPPSTTMTLSGTQGTYNWYRSNVQVTLSPTDTGGSGVALTRYSLDSGNSWYSYTSPFDVTTEGYNYPLARSWDNAGNDEGPPPFREVKIDKTPPTVSMTTNPTTLTSQRRGNLARIDYSGGVLDIPFHSGENWWNIQLIDEYGAYNQDLGNNLRWYTWVEAWARGNDTDGRKYTFRLTATDRAGNQATIDAVATVVRQ